MGNNPSNSQYIAPRTVGSVASFYSHMKLPFYRLSAVLAGSEHAANLAYQSRGEATSADADAAGRESLV